MTMCNGTQVELYHCDAAAMANTIPRAYYGNVERGVGCCVCLFYVRLYCFFLKTSVEDSEKLFSESSTEVFYFKIFCGRF
jgi:hypothetical protein